MQIEAQIRELSVQALQEVAQLQKVSGDIIVNAVPKGQQGDICVVVFPYVKEAKMAPAVLAEAVAKYCMQHSTLFSSYLINNGFINFTYSNACILDIRNFYQANQVSEIQAIPSKRTIGLEYCGPNTNKPLHLGHVRNMVLGFSVSEILKKVGHNVIRMNIYNDRGIAICKSMVAWLHTANGATPESTGIKGDHFVGQYYSAFGQLVKPQIEALVAQGLSEELAADEAPLMVEAREMLLKWEAGDAETLALWNTMNAWVYAGFALTYKAMGVAFEHEYYESETYLLGRDMVLNALKLGYCYQKPDNSIWIDLEEAGLDHKILLRKDGTSVYVTQDLGTAKLRYDEYKIDTSIYVVADEQNYHFQVLQNTLKKFEEPYAAGIHHLAYGLVELPSGRLKSREGTKVDADDLIVEMQATAKEYMQESGRLEEYTAEEVEHISRIVGMCALKFFLLRVNPKKKLLFDPKESIDFLGDTGPLVQYTHARIRSILRKAAADGIEFEQIAFSSEVGDEEKALLLKIQSFTNMMHEASREYDPSVITQYCVQLARTFNKMYASCPILKLEDKALQAFRLHICALTAEVIKTAMAVLGIEVPEKM